jgi:hypothetical protein
LGASTADAPITAEAQNHSFGISIPLQSILNFDAYEKSEYFYFGLSDNRQPCCRRKQCPEIEEDNEKQD